MRRRTLFFPIATAAVVILGQPTWRAFMVGLVLVLLGAAIRVWASGYIRKSIEIATSGPFRWVRNPLYAGSFLVTLGYCVMANRPELTALVMTVYCVLHAIAVIVEEQYLVGVFGDEFKAYCKNVPRVIPRAPRIKGSERFSLPLVWENGEHISVIWTVVVAAYFASRLIL